MPWEHPSVTMLYSRPLLEFVLGLFVVILNKFLLGKPFCHLLVACTNMENQKWIQGQWVEGWECRPQRLQHNARTWQLPGYRQAEFQKPWWALSNCTASLDVGAGRFQQWRPDKIQKIETVNLKDLFLGFLLGLCLL